MKIIPEEEIQKVIISNQETQKLLDEMSMKTHGFQASWYKNIDGTQGRKWLLATCGIDCKAGPGCLKCPGLRMAKKCGYKVCHYTGQLMMPRGLLDEQAIFVCPSGDLFHRNIPDWFIACVFAVIESALGHVYLILTKRGERMVKLLTSAEFDMMVYEVGREMFGKEHVSLGPKAWGSRCIVGVSVESQAQMDRALVLCDLPSYLTTSIHASPLISGLNISSVANSVDWLVTTKELGLGLKPRECKPEWQVSLKDQCKDFNIPFFIGDKLSKSLKDRMGGYRPQELPLLLKG